MAFTENLGRIGADGLSCTGKGAHLQPPAHQPGESTQQEKTEQREIMLLSREQNVRQRSSSKTTERSRLVESHAQALCLHQASGSLQLQLGLQIPGSPTPVAEAGGQQGSPSPGQVSLQCLIPLLSHPSFLALLQAGTHKKEADGGKSRGKCSTGLGEHPLAEGGLECCGSPGHPWGAGFAFQQGLTWEESTDPEKMEPCFA